LPIGGNVRIRRVAAAIALVAGGLAPGVAFAQAAVAAEYRARGLEHGYNLEHVEALEAFDAAIAADPHDPASYRLAAATVWTRIVFDQGAITAEDYLGQAQARQRRPPPRPDLVEKFHAYINRALMLSEERLRAHPADPDAHLQVGATFGCLASYTATVEGRVRDSLGPARRAYKSHERVLALDPTRKDAALIVGMTRHAVAALSLPLRVIAYLAGFDGNSAAGIRLVEEAARYPGETRRNALFTLVLLYNREKRYDAALSLIRQLQDRYPRNRLLWLEAGNTLLRAGRPVEAKAVLDAGLAKLAVDRRPRAPGEESRWRLALGSSLAALNDVASAERELNGALHLAVHDWVRDRIRTELRNTRLRASGDDSQIKRGPK
jgi:tetratricopeptide (TPR) repeat protein